MFNIDEKYRIHYKAIFTITSNYRVFHYDDVPILYMGTNTTNTKILGSFIKENIETDTFYYFHVQISNKQYTSFIQKKKTYLEILKESDAVFIVEKDINDNFINTYCVPFEFIPADFLPNENTYCPNTELVVGRNYSFSMNGLLADLHEAYTSQVSLISKSGEKMLRTIIDSVGIKDLGYEVHQVPFSEGSFRINFNLIPKQKPQQTSMLRHETELHEYVNAFLSYSVNELPSEAANLGRKEIDNTKFKEQVHAKLISLYQASALNTSLINSDKLIETAISVSQEFETVCDNLGKGFNEIEILSIKDDGAFNQIGLLDNEFSNSVEIANFTIDNIVNPTTEDSDYLEYEIQVFNLNTDKRKGNANIYNFKDNTRMDTPKIIIEGDEPLSGTDFTESMHLTKWIKVKAKASKSPEKIKLLKISF